MARRKAEVGDVVRVIRPKGHKLGTVAPVGLEFHVSALYFDGERCWYRGRGRVGWWRGDELELVRRGGRKAGGGNRGGRS